MKHLAPRFLTLALLLASCGSPDTPAPPKTAGRLPDSPDAARAVSTLRARPGSPLPDGLAAGFHKTGERLRADFGNSKEKISTRVLLPARASQPLHIEDAASDMAIDVHLDGARDVQGNASDGYLVYARAHASGATLLHRPMPDGVEDYLSFETKPTVAAVSYRVALAKGVAGLRLVEGTLEMLDQNGAPRLRVAPPYIVGADGVTKDAVLAVENCAVDRSPASPWDRPVTPPGASSCTVRVGWDAAGVSYPAVLDPRWSSTTSMTTARQDHTLTLLPTGKALVVGGRSSGSASVGLTTAQLFDLSTKTWATTGSISGGRFSHSATLLNTSSNSVTSGKVLVVGGSHDFQSLLTAQLYSPSAGSWTSAATLPTGHARHGHTGTLLADGRVLVTGGESGTTVLDSGAIYNPASGSGTWTSTSSMGIRRRFHTATLLKVPGNSTLNNKVLIVGGNSGGSTSLTSVQLFSGGSFSSITALPLARQNHAATALDNGNVLVTGGRNNSSSLASTYLFNASSGNGSWSHAGNMKTTREGHIAERVSSSVATNGQVIVAGGAAGVIVLGSSETWNGTNTWSYITSDAVAVNKPKSVLIASNAILVAGGSTGTSATTASSIVTLDCTSNSQCASGFCVSGVCCNSACTGQCSACNLPGNVGICSPKPNGAVCSDGDLCTQVDTCQAGACTGSDTKACPAVDACHPSSTCNPATGACPVAAAGTSCSDNNVCNGTEACDANGSCKSGTPLVCVASAGCQGPGSCHPTFGCQGGAGVGGQTCGVGSPCAGGACSTSVNVDDPTPGMEDQCWRQRDIPIRFVDFNDTGTQLSPGYTASYVNDLNRTFSRACMKFHERPQFVVPNTKFTNFATQLPTDSPGAPTGNNFNWATASDRNQWFRAVPQDPNAGHPQRPTCDFAPPISGNEKAWDAAHKVLQECGIPDELVIVSMSNRCCGFSLFPWRAAYVAPGGARVHEVGHNFGLKHVFDGIGAWGKPTGVNFGDTPQTAGDEWDLLFRQDPNGMNRYFASFGQAQAAQNAGEPIEELLRFEPATGDGVNRPTYSAIHLPGTYTNPADPMNPVIYSFPPKTGTPSCENPPDGLGSCATRALNPDNTTDYCYACEFRRMYDAWNGQGSFPPSGRPLGLVFAAGQSVYNWRVNGQFKRGFSGFMVETGDGVPGSTISGIAPKRTKLQTQTDPGMLTHNTMSYGVGRWPPANISVGPPLYDAISNSQAVLVRNIVKAELRSTPTTFGHYPARGSWEKIGQNLDTTSAPTVVPAPGGVYISALSTSGEVVVRRWSYGDAPWASQSSTPTVINGPAWQPVVPGENPPVAGWVSGAYRSDGVFDVAIRRSGGGVDELATASVTANGRQAWRSVPFDMRGAPVAFAQPGSEGARLSVLALRNSGDPSSDLLWVNQWRRDLGPGWTGWYNFNLLPNIAENGFDAAIRPNGDMDIVVMTTDGSYHGAFMNPDLGWWDWGHYGNPNPGNPMGSRASVSSTTNATTAPGNPFFQLVMTVTDNLGRVHMKLYSEQFGGQWSPSETGWSLMGGSFLGRAVVSHNANSDIDIVARDTGSRVVKLKRWRAALNAWSPSQVAWFNLGGEGVTDPVAVARPGKPDVVDVFTVSEDGSLWHRPFVVPPYVQDPKEQQHDIDYDTYCSCGFVTNTTVTLPAKRLGSADCPCSR